MNTGNVGPNFRTPHLQESPGVNSPGTDYKQQIDDIEDRIHRGMISTEEGCLLLTQLSEKIATDPKLSDKERQMLQATTSEALGEHTAQLLEQLEKEIKTIFNSSDSFETKMQALDKLQNHFGVLKRLNVLSDDQEHKLVRSACDAGEKVAQSEAERIMEGPGSYEEKMRAFQKIMDSAQGEPLAYYCKVLVEPFRENLARAECEKIIADNPPALALEKLNALKESVKKFESPELLTKIISDEIAKIKPA